MEIVDCCFSNCSSTTTPAITALYSDIIKAHILPKLDGPTLASTSCASSELNTVCSHKNLWNNICDSSWPSTIDTRVQDIISSFPLGHQSFFADSFPTIDYKKSTNRPRVKTDLLSSVDVHVGDELLYSKVLVEDDMPGWYTNSFLRIDLFDGLPVIKIDDEWEESECIKFIEEKLKLSWIMIDSTRKRAVNLSSVAPVKVQRHWMSKDYIQVHYGIVAGDLARFEVMVTCGRRRRKKGRELEVIQIYMQVEDLEGKMMSGKDSLVILNEVMDSRRAKRGIGLEKKRLENFMQRRGIYRVNKDKRRKIWDMVWITTCFILFMTFWSFIFFS